LGLLTDLAFYPLLAGGAAQAKLSA